MLILIGNKIIETVQARKESCILAEMWQELQSRRAGGLFQKAGEWAVMLTTSILILLCHLKHLNFSDLVS